MLGLDVTHAVKARGKGPETVTRCMHWTFFQRLSGIFDYNCPCSEYTLKSLLLFFCCSYFEGCQPFLQFLLTLNICTRNFSNLQCLYLFTELTVSKDECFWIREGSLMATTVVLVVTVFEKCLAFLINHGKLQNLEYTFVTSFPTDLLS